VTGPAFTVSAATWRLYGQLGPYAAADVSGELLAWLEGTGRLIQTIEDLSADTAEGPGWSQVLDVNRAPTYVLPWRGQLNGVTVDPTLSDAAQRAQIATESGFDRGRPDTIVAAAQPFLTNRKVVRLTERDGDAYHLTVTVFTRDLAGGTWDQLGVRYPTWNAVAAAYPTWNALGGDVNAQLAAAVDKAKPAALTLNLVIASGGTWNDVVADFATWNALAGAFPTWNALAAWTPPA